MKKLAILIFVTLTTFANAQTTTVKGTVIDSENQPVEFANAILINKTNSKIITGVVTDSKGSFAIETSKKDNLIIQISFIGFEDYSKEINTSQNTINIGNITLKSDNQLDEIVFVGRRKIIEQKADRLIFNVGNSPFLKGSDGMEILTKVPKLITKDDKITMLGKDNVRVMINGRMSQMKDEELTSYLQSLTDTDIKKIEVITSPPAKYSAEGNMGIINIVLNKKQADYYSGNIKLQSTNATFHSGKTSGSFNLKKGKWQLSSSLSYADNKNRQTVYTTINYPTQIWDKKSDWDRNPKSTNGRIALDYELSDKTSIGVQYSGGYSKTSYSIFKAKTKIYNLQNTIDSLVVGNNISNNKTYDHSLNGHFQTKLDTLGKNLSVDVDYYTDKRITDDLIKSSTPNILQEKNNTGTNKITSYSGKLDLELPYDFVKIETGAKASVVTNNSQSKNYDIVNAISTLNTNESNDFEYTENNQAIYASASRDFGDKWSVKLGLRAEFTQTNGYSKTLDETNKTNYTELFPTVYANYKVNKNHSLNLNYNRRIQRPSYFRLNPFKTVFDLYTYTEGNPLLRPTFIENYELSHSYKNIFQTSVYYQHRTDGINQVSLLKPNNTQQYIHSNSYNSDEYGITESISFDVTKFWNTTNTAYVYYSKVTPIIPELENDLSGMTAYLSTDNTFLLNKDKTLSATINYLYQFPEKSIDGHFDHYSSLNIGFKALLLDKNLILKVHGYDLFKTQKYKFDTFYKSGNSKTSIFYNDTRKLIVSLTYRFGNNKIRGKHHQGSNSEEKNRAN